MNQHFHCMYFLKQLMDGFFHSHRISRVEILQGDISGTQCIPTYCYYSGQFLSCKSGL